MSPHRAVRIYIGTICTVWIVTVGFLTMGVHVYAAYDRLSLERIIRPTEPQSGAARTIKTSSHITTPGKGPVSQTLVYEITADPKPYEITAYSFGCTLPRNGIEPQPQRGADGRWPRADITVAADTSLHPLGSEVLVEGLGFRTVGDRGSAIKGRRLDLFVDSCREAVKFGRQWLKVYPVPTETTQEATW